MPYNLNPDFGCPDEDLVILKMLCEFWLEFLFWGREIVNLFCISYTGRVKRCILNKTAEFLQVNKYNAFTYFYC